MSAAVLANRLQTTDASAGTNPFEPPPTSFGHNELGLQALDAAGGAAPAAYVQYILPVLVDAMERYQRPHYSSTTVLDSVWTDHMWGLEADLSDALLRRMASALRNVASNDASAVADVFAALASRPFHTGHFLVAQGYAANPEVFADTAIDWLVSTPGALELGYSTARSWVSRELIASATPHCTNEQFDMLVDRLTNYTTDWERRPDNLARRGYMELCLLNALAPERRSDAVRKRLDELRRKFGILDCPPPTPTVFGGFVGSPIPAAAVSHMTDAQWLSAINRYRTDDEHHIHANGQFTGGAFELAGMLEEQTKTDPKRFANLAFQLPLNVNLNYPAAILRGLIGAPIDSDILLRISRFCYELDGHDLAPWLLRLIESNAAGAVDDELVALVCLIATDGDNASEHGETSPHEGSGPEEINIDEAGLNSTRGTAARTLGALLRHDPARRANIEPALTTLARDPVPAVRVEAISAIAALWPLDHELAIRLVNDALVDAPGYMLASIGVWHFLLTAYSESFDQLVPTLNRMLTCGDDTATTAAVRLITLASLQRPELDLQIDAFLAGSPTQKAAATEVFAAYIGASFRRDRSQAVIAQAFDDQDSAVRHRAERAFHSLRDVRGSLREFEDLFTTFAASHALSDSGRRALDGLSNAVAELPQAALTLCEAIVAQHGGQLGDIRTSAAADAFEINKIVLRVYAQHTDRELRRRCLDLIDAMVSFEAGGIDEELSGFER